MKSTTNYSRYGLLARLYRGVNWRNSSGKAHSGYRFLKEICDRAISTYTYAWQEFIFHRGQR